MLHWIDKQESFPWSTGSARLFVDEPRPTGSMPMAVRCRFGSQPEDLAMLDTGAHWTLVGSELIELLGNELGEGLGSVMMSTRLGRFPGTLHRLPIQLLADQGKNVLVEGTCLALPTWEGPSILGVHGFLERIRFALEPESAHSVARIHFGDI